MSDSTLTIDIDGEAELSARLARIAGHISDLKEPMKELSDYLITFFSGDVFASRGGVIDEPWAALTDDYAAEKAIEFPGAIPLIRTGEMNQGFIAKSGRLSTTIYNEADWFDFHQGGTARMPARVMMKIDQTREEQIVDIIEEAISEDMD